MRRFIVLALAFGCRLEPGISDPPGDGFVDILVAVDGARSRVEGLGVTLTRVDVIVVTSTGDERLITVLDEAREIAIPRPSFGVPSFVIRGVVPAGVVQQVRFVMESAFIRIAGATETLELDVIVPSGSQTGLKGVPRHDATVIVPEAEVVRALTTIDLAKQLHAPPGRGFMLKPTSDLMTLDRPTLADFVGADEAVLSTMASEFPETGVRLERAKVIDTTTGFTRNIVIDQEGTERDYAEVVAAEMAAYRAAHGALEPLLVGDLPSLSPDSVLDLTVLVAVPPDFPFEAPANGDLDPAYATFNAQLAAAHGPFVDGAVAAIAASGGVITGRSDLTSELRVRASRQATTETLAFLPELARIDLERPVTLAGVSSALDLIEDQIFPFYESIGAVQPQGVRIVIEEPGCADLTLPVFSLANVEQPVGAGGGDVTHATEVAQIAAGRFFNIGTPLSGFSGAYRSTLTPVCDISFGLTVNAGPNVVNESFVTSQVPSIPEAVRDTAIFRNRFFLANGAGNDPTSHNRCHMYNSVCVGGYDARETFGLDQFDDDTPVFAFLNFAGTGREQPLLVAKATEVHVIAPFGQGGFLQQTVSGTSFATPAISGLAGLAGAIFPNLRTEPTLIRAALMVSARHDIEVPRVAIVGDAIDDRDGVGAPRADRLIPILLTSAAGGPNAQLRGGILDRDVDFDANGEVVIPFTVSEPGRLRVALTWDVCPYAANLGVQDHLTIDLDLVLEAPSGASEPLKSNASLVDNYEMLDVNAFDAGTWKIRIQAPRWQGCDELGVGSRRTFYAVAFDRTPFLE